MTRWIVCEGLPGKGTEAQENNSKQESIVAGAEGT